MGKVLITGNGFDLFHGLPSKYGHFMAVMRTIEEFDFRNELTFKDLFGSHFKTEFQNDYDEILKNYKTEEIVFEKEKIKELAEKLKTNNWYNYFKTVLEVETWIDFENEINKALSEIIELLNQETNDPITILINSQKHSLLELFNLYKKNHHVQSERINKDYLFFEKSKNGLLKSQRVNNKKIFENLSISLDQFIIIFNRYFIDIIEVFYKNISLKYNITLREIDKIFTFNYTPTIEKIYNVDNSKIVYLHGKINFDDNKQNIILGVDEITDKLKNHKLYNFTKYFQRAKKGTNNVFIELPSERKSAPNQIIFYIIGHSLDSSDREYIEDVFKFLELDKSENSKIIVFYFNPNDHDNKLKNLFSIIDKTLITEMHKQNRIKFVELNEENINKEFGVKIINRYDYI